MHDLGSLWQQARDLQPRDRRSDGHGLTTNFRTRMRVKGLKLARSPLHPENDQTLGTEFLTVSRFARNRQSFRDSGQHSLAQQTAGRHCATAKKTAAMKVPP